MVRDAECALHVVLGRKRSVDVGLQRTREDTGYKGQRVSQVLDKLLELREEI